ncbi:MAG: sulfite exporter TauE/SafE family protein [Betaproteobacteria bacterium]|nr:sulfite exporter TauE/SafE family protein [Betaproteobacteria bacterium]
MVTLLSTIALGFFLGMRHATDADHVIAVATIVGRSRSLRPAAVVGALWGIGHSATVLLVGGAMVLFEIAIPPGAVHWLELAVGAMLVLLGIFALVSLARRDKVDFVAVPHPHTPLLGRDAAGHPAPLVRHAHLHVHGDHVHSHRHGHGAAGHGHSENATTTSWLDRNLGSLPLYHALRPVLVGIVHGLAGSAAVALVVLGAIRDPWWGIAYLLVFGVGTIAGMMIVTAVIALPFALSARRLPRLNTLLQAFSGVLSLGFGAYLLATVGQAL